MGRASSVRANLAAHGAAGNTDGGFFAHLTSLRTAVEAYGAVHLRAVIRDEIAPWALGEHDLVRERVAAADE